MDAEETIAHYEEIARHYATLIDPEPPEHIRRALDRFAAVATSPVLEIASGVGRDADYLEARKALSVRRTDATQEFIAIQQERGRTVEALDVTHDDLGGPYGGAVAIAVLMHIPDVDLVLQRLAETLLPGAPLLVITREGEGQTPPPAAMTFYTREDFETRLVCAGLHPVWADAFGDDEESWMSYLAVRPGAPS